MTNNSNPVVRWPSHYAPAAAPVHVRNTIEVAAPIEAVWAWLIRAQHWPDWYVNASRVVFLHGTPPDLSAGARFKWTTFGVRLESTVLEFLPPERIAWDAQGIGVDAYHAWVLSSTPVGTHVLTEETQHGWLARLGHLVMPWRMHKYHQIWLEGLRVNAEGAEIARTRTTK
jgi:uncharacterized protein YndB with AHSA1/START domain